MAISGRSFFQPGIRLEHSLRGLKKSSRNLRGLKCFDLLVFTGPNIFEGNGSLAVLIHSYKVIKSKNIIFTLFPINIKLGRAGGGPGARSDF